MFPWQHPHRSVRPDAKSPEDPKGGGRLVILPGYGVEDRVRMVFAAASISTIEPETKAAVRQIMTACRGADPVCVANGIANAVWSMAVYDGEEGMHINGDREFDVYRTFKRIGTTGRFDCDCASASSVALAHLCGLVGVVRVIEQRAGQFGGWSWTHIFPIILATAIPGVPPFPGLGVQGYHQVPLELTPVPPDGHKAEIGWQTPRSTYRRHLDFLYEPDRWRAWLSASDLDNGRFAPLPGVRQATGVKT